MGRVWSKTASRGPSTRRTVPASAASMRPAGQIGCASRSDQAQARHRVPAHTPDLIALRLQYADQVIKSFDRYDDGLVQGDVSLSGGRIVGYAFLRTHGARPT